jgi:hypothetical protein
MFVISLRRNIEGFNLFFSVFHLQTKPKAILMFSRVFPQVQRRNLSICEKKRFFSDINESFDHLIWGMTMMDLIKLIF